jgi:hypothetical protein
MAENGLVRYQNALAAMPTTEIEDMARPLDVKDFPDTPGDLVRTALARIIKRRMTDHQRQNAENERFAGDLGRYESAKAEWENLRRTAEEEADRRHEEAMRDYRQALEVWEDEMKKWKREELSRNEEYEKMPACVARREYLERVVADPKTVEEWYVKYLHEDVMGHQDEKNWDIRVWDRMKGVALDQSDPIQKAEFTKLYQRLKAYFETRIQDLVDVTLDFTQCDYEYGNLVGVGYLVYTVADWYATAKHYYYDEYFRCRPYIVGTGGAININDESMAFYLNKIITGEPTLNRQKSLDCLLPPVPHPPVMEAPAPVKPEPPKKEVKLPPMPEKPVSSDQRAHEDFKKEELPYIQRYPRLGEQLTVFLQIKATRGQVNDVLEAKLYGDENRPITKTAKEYGDANWLFGGKRGIIRQLESATVPHIQDDLADLHDLLVFMGNVENRVRVISESGNGEKKKEEQMLLKEVIAMCDELVESISLELEIRITCPDLELPQIGNIVETMQSLGSSGEKAIDILNEVLIRIRSAKEAVEMTDY